MEIKSGNIESYINKPNPGHCIFLFYGQDSGLVTERAAFLEKSALSNTSDPFASVRIDGQELVSDPVRLSDEANTVGLFGDGKVIRINAIGSKSIHKAIEPLLQVPPENTWIIIEAGDLKKSAPVRKIIEKATIAAALPCYIDAVDALNKVLDDELKAANLRISPDARQNLIANLGADRLASRGEIRKLCLYAHGEDEIDVKHVDEIVGDVAQHQTDRILDSIGLGDMRLLERELQQALSSGNAASGIAIMALRHFQNIERACNLVENGSNAASALQKTIPYLHFKRRTALTSQIQRWSVLMAKRACIRLNTTILEMRQNYALSETILVETLTAIASSQRNKQR